MRYQKLQARITLIPDQWDVVTRVELLNRHVTHSTVPWPTKWFIPPRWSRCHAVSEHAKPESLELCSQEGCEELNALHILLVSKAQDILVSRVSEYRHDCHTRKYATEVIGLR